MFEETLRSHHGIFVDFDKICVFYDKYVFIIVKIKRVNSDRICDKVNFTIKHITFYQNTHKYYKF